MKTKIIQSNADIRPRGEYVGQVRKDSGLYKTIKWVLNHPKSFYACLIGLGVVCVVMAWIVLNNQNKVIPFSPSITPTIVGSTPGWVLVGQTQQTETYICRHYRRTNGAEMTSCYEYDGARWNWVTGY